MLTFYTNAFTYSDKKSKLVYNEIVLIKFNKHFYKY